MGLVKRYIGMCSLDFDWSDVIVPSLGVRVLHASSGRKSGKVMGMPIFPEYGDGYHLGRKLHFNSNVKEKDDVLVEGFYFGHKEGKHYFLEVDVVKKNVQVYTAPMQRDGSCLTEDYLWMGNVVNRIDVGDKIEWISESEREFVINRVKFGLPRNWRF